MSLSFFFYLYSLSSILHGAWVPPSLSVSKTLAQEVLVFYAGVISSFLAGPHFLLHIFFLIDLIVYVFCVELFFQFMCLCLVELLENYCVLYFRILNFEILLDA